MSGRGAQGYSLTQSSVPGRLVDRPTGPSPHEQCDLLVGTAAVTVPAPTPLPSTVTLDRVLAGFEAHHRGVRQHHPGLVSLPDGLASHPHELRKCVTTVAHLTHCYQTVAVSLIVAGQLPPDRRAADALPVTACSPSVPLQGYGRDLPVATTRAVTPAVFAEQPQLGVPSICASCWVR